MLQQKQIFLLTNFYDISFIKLWCVQKKNEIIPWLKSDSGSDMTLMAEKPDEFIALLRTKADNLLILETLDQKNWKTIFKIYKRFFKVKQHLPVLMSAYV